MSQGIITGLFGTVNIHTPQKSKHEIYRMLILINVNFGLLNTSMLRYTLIADMTPLSGQQYIFFLKSVSSIKVNLNVKLFVQRSFFKTLHVIRIIQTHKPKKPTINDTCGFWFVWFFCNLWIEKESTIFDKCRILEQHPMGVLVHHGLHEY